MHRTLICLVLVVSLQLDAAPLPPALEGKSAITVDCGTGEIVYAKDIDRVRYPASLTKMLTAIVFAQNRQKTDLLTYSAQAASEYPYVLSLPPGTVMSAETAMDGLLLFSGNDIARMIADEVGGGVAAFAVMMNSYAQGIGLRRTHCVNPSGLHDIGHYSTAYEQSVVVRHLADFPWIMDVSGKRESVLRFESGDVVRVRNRNKLVGIDGCIAGKTGWTPEAGRCLAVMYERDGRRMAGVILDSEYDPADSVVFDEMAALIDYCYAATRIRIVEEGMLGNEVMVEFPVFALLGPITHVRIPLEVRTPIEKYPFGPPLSVLIEIDDIDPWNLDTEKSIGTVSCREKETDVRVPVYPLLSTRDIVRMHVHYYAFFGLIVFFLLLVVLVILYFNRRDRTKRA